MGVSQEDGDFVDDVTLVLSIVLPDGEDLAVELGVGESIQSHGHRLPFLKVDHIDLGQVGSLDQPLGEIRDRDGTLPGIDRTALLGRQVGDGAIERRGHFEGSHARLGGIHSGLQDLELIFIRATFHAVKSVLGFIQLGFLQVEIVLGFDDPVFGSGTFVEFGLGTILVALPGLDQVGADLGARDFLGVFEIMQIVIGFVEVFFGLFEVDDGLGEVLPEVLSRSLRAFCAETSSS